MDEHCEDHNTFLTSITEMGNDIKWIKGALKLMWGFIVVVVLGGVVFGIWINGAIANGLS